MCTRIDSAKLSNVNVVFDVVWLAFQKVYEVLDIMEVYEYEVTK